MILEDISNLFEPVSHEIPLQSLKKVHTEEDINDWLKDKVEKDELVLEPKLDGLTCCLTYENDNYIECRKQLPEVGKMVETEYGIGKVVSEDVLNLKYTVNINNELKEIKVADNGNRKE